MGLALVGAMALLGAAADVLSHHVTHFSYDEQHTDLRLSAPGARAASRDRQSFDGDRSHFQRLDRDGDGHIDAAEAAELRWTDRFLGFLVHDYDTPARRDGRIQRDELPRDFAALDVSFRSEYESALLADPHGRAPEVAFAALELLGDAAFDRLDRDHDGAIDRDELVLARQPLRPFESPERAFELMDHDGDGAIAAAEYPGAPVLHTFWLGTDALGRDVLTRLLYGARISMTVALLATLVSLVIGVAWGAIAGWLGGRVDAVMMRLVDVLYGLPFMFIVILLIVVAGRSTVNLFLALGAVQWLTMARVVRGQVLSLKQREFVLAAVAMGVPSWRIVTRHLVPNALGPVVVYATLMVPAVILEEAFLSFLGLGVQPPYPSWGAMLTDGTHLMEDHPWLLLGPALCLGVTLLALNLVGDGLRDALDPRSRT